MIDVKVKVNTEPLSQIRTALGSLNRVPPHPAFVDMGNQWLRRVESFTRRRFDRFSKGGGNWPPLALSTVNGRAGASSAFKGKTIAKRNGLDHVVTGSGKRRLIAQPIARDTTRGGGIVKTTRRAAILVNTGTLKAALTIGSQGNVAQQIPGGVRYGIEGGRAARAFKATGSSAKGRKTTTRGTISTKATLGQIARWHQDGAGRLPKREIVVTPDAETVGGMERDLARAVRRIVDESRKAGSLR